MSHLFDMAMDRPELDGAVAEALLRQDSALALLERLRGTEPFRLSQKESRRMERRSGLRWPKPTDVTIELHDGVTWHAVTCPDIGGGGARLLRLPEWANGPTPVRLQVRGAIAILALADVMWRDGANGPAGLRFEFGGEEEADYWTASLTEAVLTAHAIG